ALQSQVAKAAAERIGGADPQAYLPFDNEWLGPTTPGRLPMLRRGEPLIDLEELGFSLDSKRRTLLEAAARASFHPSAHPSSSLASWQRQLAATSGARADPFDAAAIESFARVDEAHRRAAIDLASFLARGDERGRGAARDALAEIEKLLPSVGSFADSWRKT